MSILLPIIIILLIVLVIVSVIRQVKKTRQIGIEKSARKAWKSAVIFIPLILITFLITFLFLFGYLGPSPTRAEAYESSLEYLENKLGKSPQGYSLRYKDQVIESSENPQQGYIIMVYEYAGATGTLKLSYKDYDINEMFNIEQIE